MPDRTAVDPARLLSFDLALFQGISVADIAPFDLQCRLVTLEPWQSVFNHQDESRDVYFLLSGTLIALVHTKDGREVVFTRFAEGACFGELAALSNEPRSLSVLTRAPTTVLVMRQKSFLALFNGLPVFRDRIVADLITRIHNLTTRNLELSAFTVEQRVASYLMRLAIDFGLMQKGRVLENAPTHAEIAASVGANREMISRIMARLTREGVIRSARQRIEIVDPEWLSAQF